MARHLIASVGTSLLINWRKASQSSARPEAEELTGWIANQDPKSASAETNTLMLLDAGEDDCITFIHSDTLEGELCARVLSSHYETRCRGAEAKVAKGLGRQPKSFENGLKEMVQVVKDAETAAAAAGNTPVLCVTGGFKAQTAVLTAYAMLKQIPAHYVHEDATGLLTLPKLPIAWSTSTVSENSKFFEVLDDAEATAATKAGIVKAHQNLEDLVIRDEAEVPYLNVFGELLYQAYQASTGSFERWPVTSDKAPAEKDGVSKDPHHRPRGWEDVSGRLRRLGFVTRVAYDKEAHSALPGAVKPAPGTIADYFIVLSDGAVNLPLRISTTVADQCEVRLAKKAITECLR